MRNLVRQLKSISTLKNDINPDAVFVRVTKQDLMRRIEATRVPKAITQAEAQPMRLQEQMVRLQDMARMFMPDRMIRAVRPLATVALALLLTTGGWIASAYAAPGDALWQAKVAVSSVIERGQLAFADDTGDVELNLAFASKRAQVIKDVVARVDVSAEKKKKIIQDSTADIAQQFSDAETKLDTADVGHAPDLIKDVSLKTKEIAKSLQETAQQVKDDVGVQDTELIANLDIQAQSSNNQSLTLVEKVVQKKVDAQQSISEEEKLIIRDHITSVVSQIEKQASSAKEQADTLSTTINVVPVTEGTQTVVATNTIDMVSADTTTTKAMGTSTSDIKVTSTVMLSSSTTPLMLNQNAVRDVQQKASDTVSNVAEQKTQVNELVDIDIVEALKKTRVLSDSVSETVKEVADVSKEVLPQIQNSGTSLPEVTSTTLSTSTTSIDNNNSSTP